MLTDTEGSSVACLSSLKRLVVCIEREKGSLGKNVTTWSDHRFHENAFRQGAPALVELPLNLHHHCRQNTASSVFVYPKYQ